MTRILVSILLTFLLLFGSWLIYKKFTSNIPEKTIITSEKYLKSVTVEQIKNKDIPIYITSHGKLVASQKVVMIPEATGIIRSTSLKEGVKYKSGETIFEIDSEELKASLESLRSEFRGKLILTIPELKLDHGTNGIKWENYLKNVDIQSNLPKLPNFNDIREENFMTTNGIVALYQRVKNLEIRLSKYHFLAPFDGIITLANVQEGSFVGIGQPVGEISSFGDYELELPISISNLPYLKVGNKINLSTIEGNFKYIGSISRISPRASIDAQSIIVYITVKDANLREGMFLEAKMSAGLVNDASEIDRNLLNKDNEVFVLNEADSTLFLQKVETVYFNEKTAIIKGLKNGTTIVSKLPSGAYLGMKVTVLNTMNN